MLKVALIVPSNEIVSTEKLEMYQWEQMWEYKARKKLWSTPDLGLLTIAGMLPEDFTLEYIDLNYVKKDKWEYDWAFFSPTTSQIDRAYKLAKDLRAVGVKVAMGGVHVSVLPGEALEHADSIIIGEAEGIFNEFIDDMRAQSTKGVYISKSPPDLSETPIPRYDLIKNYPYNSIPLQTSRGCPHQCSFCISSKLYGKKIRRKSISQVSKELESILKVYKNPLIFFTDDNIFVNNKYGLELVKLIGSFDIRWYAFSDASIAYKEELLEEISKAGCMQLLIGFESLEEESLIQMNQSQWKRDKLQQYEYVISKIQSLGVGVVGSFVLGMDDNTHEYFQKLYNFIMKTNIYATNITVLTPFPGTEIFDNLNNQNRIFTNDWSRYNGFELTFQPRRMSIKDFEKEYTRLNKRINSVDRRIKVSEYFINIYKEKNRFSSNRP